MTGSSTEPGSRLLRDGPGAYGPQRSACQRIHRTRMGEITDLEADSERNGLARCRELLDDGHRPKQKRYLDKKRGRAPVSDSRLDWTRSFRSMRPLRTSQILPTRFCRRSRVERIFRVYRAGARSETAGGPPSRRALACDATTRHPSPATMSEGWMACRAEARSQTEQARLRGFAATALTGCRLGGCRQLPIARDARSREGSRAGRDV